MRKKTSLLVSLLALSCFAEAAFKSEKPSEMCGVAPESYRASARHIEGKGIGYTKGYTSVDLFLAPPPTVPLHFVPFVDGRLHVFNNGRVATNIGVGLRYLSSSFVYGINSYYDYRETSRQKYNQYSIGLEALGKVWDFRINGYLPVGAKFSPFYNARFGYFTGNQMVIKGDVQFAMKGLNAEAGIHIKKMKNMEFYGAFGPYYFEKRGQNAIGGKIRVSGTFLNHIKVEGSTSYDSVFHWIGQGELSFVFPFGPNKKIAKREGSSCSKTLRIRERALQPVDRQEIVVLSKENAYATAIDPRTGQPFKIFFMNNTSSSDGTYESPHHSLIDLQNAADENHILMVQPGDGTDRNMDTGLLLKDGQKLWGSGVAHQIMTTQGMIVVPAQDLGSPVISNRSTSGDVITCGNNNDIEGLNISEMQGNSGIIINGKIGNYNIANNIISTNNGSIGVQTTGSGLGNINIQGNQFLANDASVNSFAIWRQAGGLTNYKIDNNVFQGSSQSNGWRKHIVMTQEGSSFESLITNNTFSAHVNTTIGIHIGVSGSSSFPAQVIVDRNRMEFSSGVTATAGVKLFTNNTTTAVLSGVFTKNSVTIANPGTPGAGYWFDNLGSPSQLQITFTPDNIGSVSYLQQ